MEDKITVANLIIILLLISIAGKLWISFSWVWWAIGGIVFAWLIIFLIYIIPRGKIVGFLRKILPILWDILKWFFWIAMVIAIINGIFFNKKEEPKGAPSYINKLDNMTEEERDDYFESLGFSTERSREKNANNPETRYLIWFDKEGKAEAIDKCKDNKHHFPINLELCKEKKEQSTFPSPSYIPSSNTSFNSYSSEEECIEPENPYDEFTEEWHYAGFEWAERTWWSCNGNSDSFNEWCEEYYLQEEVFSECEDRQ